MTLRSSARMRWRPSDTRSAVAATGEEASTNGSRVRLAGERVYDFVDAHAIGHRGVLDVPGIVLGVGPLPAVAHVGIPVDEQHRALAVVENRPQVRHVAAFFPASSGEERSQPRDL